MTQGLKNEKSKYYSEVAFTRSCENVQSNCHRMLTGDKGRSLYVMIDGVSFYWMTSIYLNTHYRIVRAILTEKLLCQCFPITTCICFSFRGPKEFCKPLSEGLRPGQCAASVEPNLIEARCREEQPSVEPHTLLSQTGSCWEEAEASLTSVRISAVEL